eukprot:NODE_9_length_47730_cov_0.323718.p2 type:complete len:781 gc:universal NODE_9_length_47730_cov_0.323718:17967-15625(-)
MVAVDDEAFLNILIQRASDYHTIVTKMVVDSAYKLDFLKTYMVQNENYHLILQDDFPDEIIAYQILETMRNLLQGTLGNFEEDKFWQHSKYDLEKRIKSLKETPASSSSVDLSEYKSEISRLKAELSIKQAVVLKLNDLLASKRADFQSLMGLKSAKLQLISNNTLVLSESLSTLEYKKSSLDDTVKRIEHLKMMYLQKQDEHNTINSNYQLLKSAVYSSSAALIAESEKSNKLQTDLDLKVNCINDIQIVFEERLEELNVIKLKFDEEKEKLLKSQEVLREIEFKLHNKRKVVLTIYNQVQNENKSLNMANSQLKNVAAKITKTSTKLIEQRNQKQDLLVLNINSSKLLAAFESTYSMLGKDLNISTAHVNDLEQTLYSLKSFTALLKSHVLRCTLEDQSLKRSAEEIQMKLDLLTIEDRDLKLQLQKKQLESDESCSVYMRISAEHGSIMRDISIAESKKNTLETQSLALYNKTTFLNKRWITVNESLITLNKSVERKRVEQALLQELQLQTLSKINKIESKIVDSTEIQSSISKITQDCSLEKLALEYEHIKYVENIAKLKKTKEQVQLLLLKLNEEYKQGAAKNSILDTDVKNLNSKYSGLNDENELLSDALKKVKTEKDDSDLKLLKLESYRVRLIHTLARISAFQNQMDAVKSSYSVLAQKSPLIMNHHVLRNRIAFNSNLHKILIECQRLRIEKSTNLAKLSKVEQRQFNLQAKTILIHKSLESLKTGFSITKIPAISNQHACVTKELESALKRNKEFVLEKQDLLLNFNKLM